MKPSSRKTGRRAQKLLRAGAAVAAALAVAGAGAGQPTAAETQAEIERYRAMLAEDNPAELYAARGEELWNTPRGPKQAALAGCDLGLGPGVVAGAYAQTPRWFADAGRVMDIEARLAWCMETLQGFSAADIAARPFGSEDHKSDMEALVAYVVTASRGYPIAPSQKLPQERAAYALGKSLFALRAGPYDFSCQTCHSQDGKRIRLQELPNLTRREDVRRAYTGWPAYRVSQGEFRTMQWRINDCFRQQRFPQPKYLSETVNALITYLAVEATGATYNGPAMKR
ncbi:MAG: sulfur oxidation c-type cytochrome SoxA [Rhodocyclaceae bacterium]|nr:sulfur oxidation c-type cytochrome SoxA [Rhodocyclaceae bacterium]